MRSFLAALRSLVLPFGATTGKRIILDGVNGVISVYDASNVLVAQISADVGYKTFYGSGDFARLSAGTLEFNNGILGPNYAGTFVQNGQIGMSSDGHDIYWDIRTADNGQAVWRTTAPILAVGSGSGIEQWRALPMSNGWVADTIGSGPGAEYREMPDGTVMLRGCMKNGITANGTVIGTLPVGYRPSATVRVLAADVNTGTAFRHINIQSTGVMTVYNAGTGGGICLDGIRFGTDYLDN